MKSQDIWKVVTLYLAKDRKLYLGHVFWLYSGGVSSTAMINENLLAPTTWYVKSNPGSSVINTFYETQLFTKNPEFPYHFFKKILTNDHSLSTAGRVLRKLISIHISRSPWGPMIPSFSFRATVSPSGFSSRLVFFFGVQLEFPGGGW